MTAQERLLAALDSIRTAHKHLDEAVGVSDEMIVPAVITVRTDMVEAARKLRVACLFAGASAEAVEWAK